MKKQFFFGMVAAAALCGCSNNEVEQFQANNEQNAIQFGVYVGQNADSRAEIITNVAGSLQGTVVTTDGSNKAWDNQAGFGVFGYYTGQSDYATAAAAAPAATPNFMYNEKVYYSSGWTYDLTKYWPNNTNDHVSFFAYAPYATGETAHSNFEFDQTYPESGGMTAPKIKFTVNPTVTDQQDLLYASVLDCTKKPSTGDPYTNTKTIDFTFNHALARVAFKAEAMIENVNEDGTGTADDGTTTITESKHAKTTISIQRVELAGPFTKTATLNLTSGNFESSSTVITGEASYQRIKPSEFLSPATASIPLSEDIPLTGFELTTNNFTTLQSDVPATAATTSLLNKEDSYIMLIPQTISENEIQIRVIYTVETTDNALPGDKSVVTNIVTSDKFAYTFEKGKAYSFNLHLGLTSVKFGVTSITDWTTESTNKETQISVNVPINKN